MLAVIVGLRLVAFAVAWHFFAEPTREKPVSAHVGDNDIEGTAEAGDTDLANRLAVLGWNVESGDNDPAVIAEQLKELAGYDIYMLCEVHPDNLPLYAQWFRFDPFKDRRR